MQHLDMCHQRLKEVVYLVKAALLDYTRAVCTCVHMSDVYEEK